MKRIIVLTISALMLISLLSAGKMFDCKMNEIAEKYLEIQVMLALDKTDDVVKNAAAIAELSKEIDMSKVSEEHKMHFADLPEKIGMSAQNLSEAKDIKAMRAAFKDLSKPMAMWASMMLPAGINVVYCSMAPGSWLQTGKEIMNPYYGSSMLHCGSIVSEGKEDCESECPESKCTEKIEKRGCNDKRLHH
ncbi:MAG: DUF3347 domain-containing protein [Candidatus Celaenobacter polaris]|nr:DUF3347 domain-containing protein [Candidatus Celaenobacter polaris]